MSRRWPGSIALAVALMLTAACTANRSSVSEPYQFRARDASVPVDSPQLRKQKAEAGIESCPLTERASPAADGSLPDLTLPCLGGGPDVNLAGLRGAPLVLNFWSQTCGPCRAESPLFQQVHEAAGNRVRVLGIDWQDPRPGYAIGFADELGLTYPQIADPDGATRAPLRITALPITVFADADGQIVHTEFGAVDSVDELTTLIGDHLGVTVPTERR